MEAAAAAEVGVKACMLALVTARGRAFATQWASYANARLFTQEIPPETWEAWNRLLTPAAQQQLSATR